MSSPLTNTIEEDGLLRQVPFSSATAISVSPQPPEPLCWDWFSLPMELHREILELLMEEEKRHWSPLVAVCRQ